MLSFNLSEQENIRLATGLSEMLSGPILIELNDELEHWFNDPSMQSWIKCFAKCGILFNDQVVVYGDVIKELGFKQNEFTTLHCAKLLCLLKLHQVLILPESPMPVEQFQRGFSLLLRSSDNSERILCCRSLSFFNDLPLFVQFARECARSNVVSIFDSVALNNRYAYDTFDEVGWNQLVLKAVFLERPLHQIYGLKSRMNNDLVKTLLDYTRERWLANRLVPKDIVLCFQGFVDAASFESFGHFIANKQNDAVLSQYHDMMKTLTTATE